MLTLNIGTDRNGKEPTSAFKTEQQVFKALGKNIVNVKWASSEPIGGMACRASYDCPTRLQTT